MCASLAVLLRNSFCGILGGHHVNLTTVGAASAMHAVVYGFAPLLARYSLHDM